MMPPVTNLQEVDAGLNLRLVRDQAQRSVFRYAMTNSFGFAGTNASLIFRAEPQVH
jgi:3-oxoacyl-(acyl-carrier-protein) synthase